MSKDNGHDPLTVQMVDLLREIRDGIKATNASLEAFRDETRGELTDIRGELREIHHEIAETNVRVTDLRNDMREQLGGPVEARLRRLEDAVFKKAS
jgi:hypothetical protein